MSATTVPQADTDGPPRADRPPVRSLPGDTSRLPLYVFIVVDLLAIPVFLWIGRRQWFFLDEWDFLATRDGGSISDLLTSHNEHWTTVPIIVYRVLWNLFGLHTYLPYQLVPLLLHVAAAALLLVVIRRAGVNPWIATAAASLFALFGSGSQNVVWAFQITFVGALAFGLAQLCLADHEGRIDWRDFAALGCGLLAMMCSGVGVTMVVIVGIAMFLRRGWVIAAMQTIPLAVIYAAWFSAYGEGQGNAQNSSTPSEVVRFTARRTEVRLSRHGSAPRRRCGHGGGASRRVRAAVEGVGRASCPAPVRCADRPCHRLGLLHRECGRDACRHAWDSHSPRPRATCTSWPPCLFRRSRSAPMRSRDGGR